MLLSKSGKWRPIHWWLAVLNMNSLQQVLRKQRAAHCITLICWSSNNATSLFIKKFVLFWEKKMSFTWAWIWAIGTDSIMRILTKKLNIVKKITPGCYYSKTVVSINVDKVMRQLSLCTYEEKIYILRMRSQQVLRNAAAEQNRVVKISVLVTL